MKTNKDQIIKWHLKRKESMKASEIIEREVRSLQDVYSSLPWENKEFYKNYIAQTYFYVRNATRVLSKAAYKCSHYDNELHRRLIQSIIEERNHEIMAINDLKELGSDIKYYQESPETAAYHLTLMAQIDLEGPYALIGYFVPIEGLAGIGADNVLNNLLNTYGKKASQFLRVHIRVDAHHYHEGVQYIDTLPQDLQDIAVKNAKLSSELFHRFLLSVKNQKSVGIQTKQSA